ncbi:MAG: hypothetical protein QOE35_400 [Actinomycetota bacterium]|jgi:hypothetical protein
MTLLAAAVDPARGTPTQDLIPATLVAVLALAGLAVLARLHRSGRFGGLSALGRLAGRHPALRSLPPWASLPIAITTGSLLTAVFGFYWDVSTHIDNGRDPGPFANPAHYFILVGLAGIALAGFVSLLLGDDDEHPGAVHLTRTWRAPVGGVMLLGCGVIALAGFPLDDVWHRLFGQDVTLWGPTHVQMVSGAALATISMWVLYVEACRTVGARSQLAVELPMAGAFLVGLAALQAEFDFGVPQFRLLFQPVLIALAAGIALVTARVRLGRGGAIGAAFFFLLIRGVLALVVGGVLGRSVPHFPLFVVEAMLVELIALAVPRERPVALGAASGAAIGTIGLAAEWAWSHVWLPLPWRADLLPEAIVWSIAAGVAGGVLGGFIGRALAGDAVAAAPVRRSAAVAAGLVAVAALVWPMPTNAGDHITATVQVHELTPAPNRTVSATVTVHPASAADSAAFFNLTAWQGANWSRQRVVIDPLHRVGNGVWRTTVPVPVHGEWKAIVRLHKGRTLAALPVYMPADPGIPATAVLPHASFTRTFVRDKQILQREFVGGSPALQSVAYGSLALVGIGWVWLIAWGLTRLLRAQMDPRRPGVVRAPARAEPVRGLQPTAGAS